MPGPISSAEEQRSVRQRLTELINGYQASAAIGTLAQLGVADALAAGPSTSDELAQHVGADAHALARLMDSILDLGLFTLDDDGRYRLGELGELLLADTDASLRRLAIVSTEDWRWAAYGHLTHAVRTGEPGFVAAHGCRLWDYLASHPDAAASFAQSMARVSAARDQAIIASVDLGSVDCLVDVGGGHGGLLSVALAAYPHLRGVVFDVPSVIEGARQQLCKLGLVERCEAIAGDFRDAVPDGGDAYVLSWILHDWDDEVARRILSNCRAAMQPGRRLLIVEMVVPERGRPGAAAFERLVRQTDLEMLAVVGGRERTAAEYETLLAEAGFALSRIAPMAGMPWSVIEAQPV